ncbi:hypothetical protein N802_05010 [Knoellia sinensis KCTC 19936]|uniref:Uncharacterized protein n=1 Tax=Knoellia sinensis KCTC 19936 TaxID=1385520 RepID=A0A0A0J0Q1_9MICO|nr:hypothetical protein [Knoellia sinensis]KGN30965.1 hypothetical protein N802_05010 [Knoellia sinensis KCTC 19936]
MALLAALPVLAAVWKQGPCLDEGWGGREPFWRVCYSDLAVGVQTSGADAGLLAYLSGDVPLDQPPLSGALVALIAGFAPGDGILAAQRWVLGVWAVLAVVALVAMAWWVRPTGRHRGGDPLQVALAPVAALTLLLSPDLLGVALATAGLWAWSRRHPLAAGMLLGAGFMARTYPALLLVVVALHAWRAGRERELLRVGGGALAAVAVVGLPLLLTSPETLTRSWSGWLDMPAGLGSVWYIPTLAGHAWSPSILTVLSVLGVAVAIALAALLVLGSPMSPRLGAVALLAVAVVLVTGKAFPVQSSLWLVPLVAYAGLRWRDHLVWGLAEAVHFLAVWLYLGGLQDANRSLPESWYAVALLARVGAVVFLAVRAWQVATTFPPEVGFAPDPRPSEGRSSEAQSPAAEHPSPI